MAVANPDLEKVTENLSVEDVIELEPELDGKGAKKKRKKKKVPLGNDSNNRIE